MRFQKMIVLANLLFVVACGREEQTVSQTHSAYEFGRTAQVEHPLTWKAVLMTGDDSIRAFDNARKTLKNLFIEGGVDSTNIRELSMADREQVNGVLASSVRNFNSALTSLTVADGDACLVHLTSHGKRAGFYLKGQNLLSPTVLNNILDGTCAKRPTVVLISACYSGIFADAEMQKSNRIILTAASRDRTSFGCGSEDVYTYWDACLIDALPGSKSWQNLYADIKACVTRKEGSGFTPSLPQGFFGTDAANLPLLNH